MVEVLTGEEAVAAGEAGVAVKEASEAEVR